MSKVINGTRVLISEARLSYANVWEAKSINGSDPKYSVSLIIDKSDKEAIKVINEAIDLAIKEGVGKFGGKLPNKGALKLPLRDGDVEKEDEAYENAFFMNANSKIAPQIVDSKRHPITDQSKVYSGCFASVTVSFYAFNVNGNRGVACSLGNIMKLRDGEALGGKVNAADDFGTAEDDEFLS